MSRVEECDCGRRYDRAVNGHCPECGTEPDGDLRHRTMQLIGTEGSTFAFLCDCGDVHEIPDEVLHA